MRQRLALLVRLLVSAVLVGVALVGVPTPANGDASEAAIAAVADKQRLVGLGNLHTCAVLDSGGVECWGSNDNGQLGNGTTGTSTVPVTVENLGSVVEVSTGGSHTCALRRGGTVACWGLDGNGQLGDGELGNGPSDSSLVPVDVVGVSGATRIVAGGFHSCAIAAGGEVLCWGQDGSGQLGDGDPGDMSPVAKAVVGIDSSDPAVALAAGEFHTCALLASGAVSCWGHNGFGQLGVGAADRDDRDEATAVTGLPDPTTDPARAVTAGSSHTCVVVDVAASADDTVWCWGHNAYGQLGRTTPVNDNGTPADTEDDFMDATGAPGSVKADVDPLPKTGLGDNVDERTLEGARSVSAGQFHNCALVAGGDVRCWGHNQRGQLGVDHDLTQDGLQNSHLAQEVAGLPAAAAAAAGGFHSCAVVGSGMRCWGYNFYGQLGGHRATSPTPVTVTAVTGASGVATGTDVSCALLDTEVPDRPYCWGSNADGRLGAGPSGPSETTVRIPVAGVSTATSLDAGNGHVCALPSGSGNPRCWGLNDDGQVGDGTTTDRDTATAVAGLADASSVSAGGGLGTQERGTSCARRANGTAVCWGRNANGQLGDGGTTDSSTPVTVQRDTDPGAGVTLGDLTGVTQVSVGAFHACARTSDGKAWCWGYNGSGQLGDNSTTERHVAVPVQDDTDDSADDPLTGVAEVAAGSGHTCARMTDKHVRCWGANGSGQLGTGDNTSHDEAVEEVRTQLALGGTGVLVDADVLTAGDNHACAIRTEGSLVCWGSNSSGQLGTGGGDANVGSYTFAKPGVAAAVPFLTSVSASRAHTCATLIDTTVSCWGNNAFGQLGDGIGQQSLAPVVAGDGLVLGTNHIPDPGPDTAQTVPGAPVVVPVLANDTDADSDPLDLVSVADPVHGTATIQAGPPETVHYTPDAGFCGDEVFTYTVSDGVAEVAGTVTVLMNCPPTPAPDVVTVPEDAPTVVDVLANDTDPEPGDTLVVAAVGAASHGTVTDDDTHVTYDPVDDYCGPDAFTYDVSDGTNAPVTAAVSVTVSCANDAVTAVDDLAVTVEDTAVVWPVLGNDLDPDGDALAVLSVGTAAHGSVTTNGQTVRYQPAADYCNSAGSEDTFTYVVSDGATQDTGTVDVLVSCTNDGPRVRDDVATVAEDASATAIDVLANDTDPDGGGLTLASVAQPGHGTTAIVAGKVDYTPAADYCGKDWFSYTATTPTGGGGATVEVTVTCANDAPVAVDDAVTVDEDSSVHVHVVGNDQDVDGDTLTAVVSGAPAHGSVTKTGPGSFTYVPAPDFHGADSFAYTVSDGAGGSDTGQVTVTVAPVNDPVQIAPVADGVGPWGDTVVRALSATDPDVPPGHVYSLVSGPAGASVSAGGAFSWTPGPGQVGGHTVTVRVSDGSTSDQTSFAVTVTRRAAQVVYDGPTTGTFSDPVAVTATLRDAATHAPVEGRAVTFRIGSTSRTAATDPTGQATAALPVPGPVGMAEVTAAFAGDAAWTASAEAVPFEVLPETATAALAGRRLTLTSALSAPVTLVADLTESTDGSLGEALPGATVTFTDLAGTTLCEATVVADGPGRGVASCATSLVVGAHPVVVRTVAAGYEALADVGVVTVANTGTGFVSGGGEVGPGHDFGFHARPVRKAPPVGAIVHVVLDGTEAAVVTASPGSLARSCTSGKTKTCSATLTGAADAEVRLVDRVTGDVAAPTPVASLRVDATDVTEPDGTAVPGDTYAVAVGAPVGVALGTPASQAAITRGNVRVQ